MTAISHTIHRGRASSCSGLSHGCHTEGGHMLRTSEVSILADAMLLAYICTSTQAPIAIIGERPLEMRGEEGKKQRSIDAGWTI